MLGFPISAVAVSPRLFHLSKQRNPVIVYDFTAGNLPAGFSVQRASGGTAFDATGNIIEYGANVPRFGYNPVTHAPRGILLEAAATNLMRYSAVTVADWVAVSCTPTQLSLGALGQFAGVQVASSGSERSRIKRSVSLTSGTRYTITVYFRTGSSPNILVNLAVGGLESGVIGAFGAWNTMSDLGAVSNITNTVLADGLTQRMTFLLDCTYTGTPQVGVGPGSAVAGETITVLSIQVEKGNAPSSYIGTTESTADRAEDHLVINDLSGTYRLQLEYDDTSAQTLENVNISQGSVIPTTGRYLRTISATEK